MQQPTSELLFVDATWSSTSSHGRDKAAEKNRMLSHVQRKRRQRESKKKPEQWEKFTSCLVGSETQALAAHAPARVIVQQLDGPRLSAHRLPQCYPPGNGTDPFHCTVSGDSSAGVHALLQYAVNSPIETFLTEAFAPARIVPRKFSMRHSEVLQERLRSCLGDSALMYSTLASGSSRLAQGFGKLNKNLLPEFYLGKALQAVRERVSNPSHRVDMWFLISIYTLAITQTWNNVPELWERCPKEYVRTWKKYGGRMSSPMVHLNVLFDLVHSAGGWGNFNPYLLESVVLVDKYTAIAESKPPVFKPVWDPGPNPPGLEETDVQQSTLPRMGEKLMRTPMSRELYDIVRDIIAYARFADYAWKNASRMDNSLESWLFFRLQAFSSYLLSLDNLQGPDNCIRLATLTFLHSAGENHGSWVAARVLSARLRTALVAAPTWHSDLGKGLEVWVLCVGAMVPEPSADRDWFLDTLSSLSTRLPEEALLSSELESYLFLPDKQRRQLSAMLRRLGSLGEKATEPSSGRPVKE